MPGQDSQDITGQSGPKSHDRTAEIGLPGQNAAIKTDSAGKLGKDGQDLTVGTLLPRQDRTIRTSACKKSDNVTARTVFCQDPI